MPPVGFEPTIWAAANLRLRRLCHWDRLFVCFTLVKSIQLPIVLPNLAVIASLTECDISEDSKASAGSTFSFALSSDQLLYFMKSYPCGDAQQITQKLCAARILESKFRYV